MVKYEQRTIHDAWASGLGRNPAGLFVGIVAFYFVTKDIYRPGRDAGAGK